MRAKFFLTITFAFFFLHLFGQEEEIVLDIYYKALAMEEANSEVQLRGGGEYLFGLDSANYTTIYSGESPGYSAAKFFDLNDTTEFHLVYDSEDGVVWEEEYVFVTYFDNDNRRTRLSSYHWEHPEDDFEKFINKCDPFIDRYFEYNMNGQLLEFTEIGERGIADNNPTVKGFYHYDSLGLLRKVESYTRPVGRDSMELRSVWTLGYDNNERQSFQKREGYDFFSGKWSVSDSITYIYNDDGKLYEEKEYGYTQGDYFAYQGERYLYNQEGLIDRLITLDGEGTDTWIPTMFPEEYHFKNGNLEKTITWYHPWDFDFSKKDEYCYEYDFDVEKSQVKYPRLFDLSRINQFHDQKHLIRSSEYENLDPWLDDVLRRKSTYYYNELSTGVSDIHEKHKITIFPNPASAEITLDLGHQAGVEVPLRIFDISGRLVMSIIHVLDNAIPISALPLGSYTVEFNYEGKVYTSLFVKQ